ERRQRQQPWGSDLEGPLPCTGRGSWQEWQDGEAEDLPRRRGRRGGDRVRDTAGRGHGRPRRRTGDTGPAGPRPGGALELQGGPLRLVQRGDQRQAQAALQDARRGIRWGRDTRRSHAGLPRHKGSGLRRILELRGVQRHQTFPEQRAGALHHVRGGCRAPLRTEEVHRVLYVPGRLPRLEDPPQAPRVRGTALLRQKPVAGDAPDGRSRPAGRPQGGQRPRVLQHNQVLHRGMPGRYPHHRQLHHPPQGACRRRVLRPGKVADAQDKRKL
ncbi:MAG: Succinate dehydrogenase iron-sulfur protein, partial [uncultured Rubrobacteraceae bacterium]